VPLQLIDDKPMEREMKKLLIGGVLVLIINAPAFAEGMSKEEVAKLPQDKVQIIKQACQAKWESDFSMRIYCEDKQYKALKFLLERDSNS
jgi:hypothetical protein